MTYALDPQHLEELRSSLAQEVKDDAVLFSVDAQQRAPIHTVYGGADRFAPDTPQKFGWVALATLDAYAPSPRELAAVAGPTAYTAEPELWDAVYGHVLAKLKADPVEDFRIDFEDGFGVRSESEEDEAARAAANAVAVGLRESSLPRLLGIRPKAFSLHSLDRAFRTLEVFFTELFSASDGQVPPGFLVTLPKISSPAQVETLARLLSHIESQGHLRPNTLGMELMIETPRAVMSSDGRTAIPFLIEAAAGRCVAIHFGLHDFTSSLMLPGPFQKIEHSLCDFARTLMQVSAFGTGVRVVDSITNLMPVPVHRGDQHSLNNEQYEENRLAVITAWERHFQNVWHALQHGVFQGWDLHPGQLPVRYAATYLFFRRHLSESLKRWKNFLDNAAQASLLGNVFDDEATGQGLLSYFRRGLGCGAFNLDELAPNGPTEEDLAASSFAQVIQNRQNSAPKA